MTVRKGKVSITVYTNPQIREGVNKVAAARGESTNQLINFLLEKVIEDAHIKGQI